MIVRNFEIDGWHVDVRLGRLTKKADAVHLEPQVMKVLAFLANKPGEVVTKESLIANLWRSRYVSDAALARCVSEIRSALGDDSKNPKFIETIPKVGYRFIAKVNKPQRDNQNVVWRRVIAVPLSIVAIFLLTAKTHAPGQQGAVAIEPVEIHASGRFQNPAALNASAVVLAKQLEVALLKNEGPLVLVTSTERGNAQSVARYRLVSRIEIKNRSMQFEYELRDATTNDVVCNKELSDSTKDVFDAAELFANDVMRCFGTSISPEGWYALIQPPTRNVLAYEAFTKAREHFDGTNHATLENAAALYERAIINDPMFGLAYAYLANSLEMDARYWRGGRIDDAEAAAARAIELAPDRPESHYVLGRVRFHRGDENGALSAYETALQLNSEYIAALYASAEIHLFRNEFEAAEALLLKTLELDPDMPQAMSLLGQLYVRMGSLEKARAWLNFAVDEVPLLSSATSMLGILDIANGKYPAARERCERLNRSFPGNYYCLQVRAMVTLLDSDWGAAKQLFEYMTARWPDDEYAQLGQAQVLMAESKNIEANALLDQVATHSRERINSGERSSHHRWTLAAALSLQGNNDEALFWLCEAAAAGRRYFVWDQADPMFAKLRDEKLFKRYIAATGVGQTRESRVSTVSRADPGDMVQE